MTMPVRGGGAGVDGLQLLGDLSGAASQLSGNLSPTGKLVDLAGSTLNLPAPVVDLGKIVVGALTCDVPAIISGAAGLLSKLFKAASTDYRPCGDPAKAGAGYARPPPGSSPAEPPLDRLSSKLSSMQKEHEALMNRLASGEELDQKDQFKLQQLQQKMEQLNTLLSSVLKHQHQMAMVVIQNMGR